MTLSEEAKSRLADVVALQPTKNAELGERWEMDDGSEIHAYLEAELGEYYYRDEDSLIRATPEAAGLVDVEPGIEGDGDGGFEVVRVPELEKRVFEVLAGPEGDSMSVVATLHALRETGVDPSVEEVRSALRGLDRKGVVESVRRTVPTYRLALERESVTVETREAES